MIYLYLTLSINIHKEAVKHCCIPSYFLFTPLFLLISIALTVINTISACLFDFRDGRSNLGTFGVAVTSRCSGNSGSSMLLSCSISDSTSAAQSSSLLFGVSKCPLQFSQSSVSEMRSDALSTSLSMEWRLILRIRWTLNIWVCPPGRSFADKGGGKGDLTDNSNAAAPSCWKSNHNALTISSVSETYSTTVICMCWEWDSSA